MYAVISSLFSLITVLMFLRMHHLDGSDTYLEKFTVMIGTILFLIQAGLSYHAYTEQRLKIKRNFAIFSILCSVAYAFLFSLITDFRGNSIFNVLC